MLANTNANTPILRCLDFPSIAIHPTSDAAAHPLDSPTFDIPSSILPHLETASHHLHSSRTVALPTETVYGLAANSLDPKAVQAIYRIKNRPADNPLIIHISSLNMLRCILPPSTEYEFSRLYLALISAFWPGPLSLLFPSPNPPPLPAPQTNAIRMPSHPLALALIHYSNLPLSAPSANSSGRPSPTQAQHVYNDLNGADGLGCILDGGDCGVGVESTVVNGLDWKEGGGGKVEILRPGGMGVEEIAKIVQQVDGQAGSTEILVHGQLWKGCASKANGSVPNGTSSVLKKPLRKPESVSPLPPSTPGMKYRHYSPRVPVFLLKPSNVFPRSHLSDEAESSSQAILRQITRRLLSTSGNRRRIGFLHFDNSPLSRRILIAASASSDGDEQVELVSVSLGDSPSSAAQRLFAGMLTLEGRRSLKQGDVSDDQGHDGISEEKEDAQGVEAILIEGCSDEGLGLAVMERVTKAVGGGGIVGNLTNGEKGSGDEGNPNTFWVDVGEE